MNPFYKEYSDYLAERFEGKVQKITIDTGALCPNRDGTLGRGGCVYCSNDAFSPGTARCSSVGHHLEQGKLFVAHKYAAMLSL